MKLEELQGIMSISLQRKVFKNRVRIIRGNRKIRGMFEMLPLFNLFLNNRFHYFSFFQKMYLHVPLTLPEIPFFLPKFTFWTKMSPCLDQNFISCRIKFLQALFFLPLRARLLSIVVHFHLPYIRSKRNFYQQINKKPNAARDRIHRDWHDRSTSGWIKIKQTPPKVHCFHVLAFIS